MKKKILIKGPILTSSGYGEQARFALRALRKHSDRFDIYIITIPWGQTGWIHEDNEERAWIDQRIRETIEYSSGGGTFDISLQVTIPNEWERMAPVNIGYTAGIETNKVAPIWLEKSNMMDHVIVVSEHSKNVFEDSAYERYAEGQPKENGPVDILRLTTPITAVNYPVRKHDEVDLELDLDYDFNYLAVAQWGPRKNIENLVRWFVEENIDEKVGLVVKTSIRKSNVTDRGFILKNIEKLLSQYEDRKCKVYLLHGDIPSEEMNALYKHPKIKAFASLSHGEGFGLPLFEAAYNGMPIIAPGWSGQCDFLYAPYLGKGKKKNKNKKQPYFAEVEYDVGPVQPEAHWEGVIQSDSMWCFPQQGSYKMRLRQVRKNYSKWEKKAKQLQEWIIDNFTEEKCYEKFANAVCAEEQFNVESWLDNLGIEENE